MILAALKEKYRARGALGFATDAAELGIACTVIGAYSVAMAGAAVVAAVVGPPLLALELLARPGDERTSCRNAEERES